MLRPPLGARLEAIARRVPDRCRLTDVGTDHGYIPVSLLLEGRAVSAIATDLRPEPLARARAAALRYGVEDRLSLRLCDGLSAVSPQETDAIVIAGLGGDLITEILSAAPWCRNQGVTLLLQPMSKAEVLRSWLPEQGYAVAAECLVVERGIFYPLLTVKGHGLSDGPPRPVDPARAWGGLALEDDTLWGRYLEDRLLRLHRAAAGLAKARDPALTDKREKLLSVIGTLTEWKEAWNRDHSGTD